MKNSEKGISLVITFLIMAIMLSVVLSLSSILFNQVKIVSNVGSRMRDFYTKESDNEKALYINRHSNHDKTGI